MRIAITMPGLGVTAKGWERGKEIYVLGLAADLNPEAKRGVESVGAVNETLAAIRPDLQNAAALKWMVASVSNVFHRVRPDQPPSLSGSGIVLYPNLDPNGLLALHLSIVESDAGTRRSGRALEGILGHDEVKSAVEGMTEAGEPGVSLLMRAVTRVIPETLKGNGDDLLFSHSHSGFDWDDYGLEGRTSRDFELGNDRAYCTLRVRQTS